MRLAECLLNGLRFTCGPDSQRNDLIIMPDWRRTYNRRERQRAADAACNKVTEHRADWCKRELAGFTGASHSGRRLDFAYR